MEKTEKIFGKYYRIIFVCWLLYTMTMITKSVFTAEIPVIIGNFGITKAQASLSNTFYYITYAGVQFILPIIFRGRDLKKFLYYSVPVSCVIVALVAFATNIRQIYILFAINGAAQAGVYSGCVEVLVDKLPKELLTNANKIYNTGFAIGNALAYGISAFFVRISLWQGAFVLSGVLVLVSLILFIIIVSGMKTDKSEKVDTDLVAQTNTEKEVAPYILKTNKSRIIYYVLCSFLMFMLTALYYAVMSWVPSLFIDVHGLDDSISILISVVFPLLIVVGPIIVMDYCDKYGDMITTTNIFLIAMLPASLFLTFLYDFNIVLVIVFLTAFLIISNGIRYIPCSVVSFKMRSEIPAGGFTSIVNAVASIAAAVVPVIVGSLIDNFGFGAGYLLVLVINVLMILTVFTLKAIVVREKKKGNI